MLASQKDPISREYVDELSTPLLEEVISELRNDPDIEEFLEPVKLKNGLLKMYLDMIEMPIDLAFVEAKLEQDGYLRVHELFDDLYLMWKNCKTFNMEGSEIYMAAEDLEKKTHDLYKRFLATLRRLKAEEEAKSSDSSARNESSSEESEDENPEERRRPKKSKKKKKKPSRLVPLEKHKDTKKRFPCPEVIPCPSVKRALKR